ncbi:MAG: hypothetical protein L0Z49_04890 [Actinobacteria bacterium]|nr:hypothetical protein [Actinomycetota bacterium]MCI0543769.1 hypothetical protein [Actinomycetota bacterium]MCI0677744.1 hypothetical protein [Actinomycetota bacterium]
MPWIDAPHEEDWEDDRLRAAVTDPRWSRVDWIMRVHALDPRSVEAHHVLYRQAMRGTPGLPKVDREIIALLVSKANQCHY